MNLCDAHCHLANLNESLPLSPLLDEAILHGITRFLSSALSVSELHFYDQLSHPNICYSAGIHPFYEACDLTISDLIPLLEENKIWAIGEIGLDRANPDFPAMEKLFIKQLELAAKYQLPVVLHIVGHQTRAYEILREFKLKYLIHGYAGSIPAFRDFQKLDSYFTISERILRPDKAELLNEMIGSGRFLFETDITRHYLAEGEANPLLRLPDLVETCAAQLTMNTQWLIKVQARNYHALTGFEI